MISIVIPAYNNAKYLPRCLDSILAQNEKDFEVIVVDDGSTDDTPLICNKYHELDKRIKPIRKENGGVSSARNLGIEESTGDYIVFVDSDDYLKEDACATIINDFKVNPDKQVIIYNNLIELPNGINCCKNSESFASLSNLIFEVIEPLKNHENEWLRTIWAKAYKREAIETTSFPKNVYIGEDACFFVSLLNNLNSIDDVCFSQKAWYVYDRTNELSATHKYKKDLLVISKLQLDYLENETEKLSSYDIKYKNSVFAKFCWKLFWIMYYQGQFKEDNSNCFKWFDYTYKKYLKTDKLYKIDFENKIMNKSFKIRRLLACSLIRKIATDVYLKRNKIRLKKEPNQIVWPH